MVGIGENGGVGYFTPPSGLICRRGKRRHHDRFDGMHTVFSLIEYHAVRGFEHLVSDFHSTVQMVLFSYLLAQCGLLIMERR